MSAYKVFKEVQFRSLALLKAALADLGFTQVEEGQGLALYGYQGDVRPEKAELVIRRCHLGRLSNDVGFVRTEQGYIPVVSEYDERVLLGGKFLARLRTAYNLRVVEEVKRKLRATAVRTTEGSLTRITLRY